MFEKYKDVMNTGEIRMNVEEAQLAHTDFASMQQQDSGVKQKARSSKDTSEAIYEDIYELMPEKLSASRVSTALATEERDVKYIRRNLVDYIGLVEDVQELPQSRIDEAREQVALLMPHAGVKHRAFMDGYLELYGTGKSAYEIMKGYLWQTGYSAI